MKIFVAALKNAISNIKWRFTPFFFYTIFILTVLSFFIPFDTSGSNFEKVASIIMTGLLVLASVESLTEYLFILENLMQNTKFGNYSFLSIFIKHVEPNYHIYANSLTIVLIPTILFVAIGIMTQTVLPITITLVLITMATLFYVP